MGLRIESLYMRTECTRSLALTCESFCTSRELEFLEAGRGGG